MEISFWLCDKCDGLALKLKSHFILPCQKPVGKEKCEGSKRWYVVKIGFVEV